ncbi:unnamed protein product [Closterium sp. NIES-54]
MVCTSGIPVQGGCQRSTGDPRVILGKGYKLVVLGAQRDYELHSLDFSTAFLYGSLHEEIWLHHLPGFTGTFLPDTQWSLRRPVYGLRQVPCEWYDKLCTTLAALGFHPLSTDPSLFVRSGPTPFFVLVYVDDLVFATVDRAALTEVKSKLQKRDVCTDLGELLRILGFRTTRDRDARTITNSQLHMVQQVLQRFTLKQSTTQPTPLAVDHRLTGPSPNEPFESSGPYAELVGCLMFVMTCTRPDLAFPLSVLSRFVANGRHRPVLWTAAVRVAKYLATASGMGLVLGGRLVTATLPTPTMWRHRGLLRGATSAWALELCPGGLLGRHLWLCPVQRQRSTLVPWLRRSFVG